MKVAALILTMFLAAVSAVGQGKEITSAEYFDAYAPAIQKGLETPHRRTSKAETYKAGRLVSVIEELEERDAKEYFRFLRSEKIGVRVKSDEYRKIRGIYYCRRDAGKWLKSKTNCSVRHLGKIVSGSFDPKVTYSFEPLTDAGKKLQQYTQTTIFSGKTDSSPLVSSHENKVWLNEDGMIVKREYREIFRGIKNYRVQVDVYDYDAKFSTAPPIK